MKFASDLNSDQDPEKTLSPQSAALHRLCPEAISPQERYQVGSPVAKGGMGIILEAWETATGRRVAMKVMNPDAFREGLIARFVEEARVTAQLEHPNIVPVHEFGVDCEQRLFYTMKFVEGITLQEILDRLGRSEPEARQTYPLAQLLTIFQKICDAVSFAHSRGVIHRDLKPANIMVGRFGEVLLMDWGLAKQLKREEPAGNTVPQARPSARNLTSAGAVIGTPHYMAPEQAGASVELADERTDIYALGAILYSLITLRPPVEGENVDAILANVRAGRIAPIPRAETARHASLVAVIERAMSVRPVSRYQTVAGLQDEISAYQSGFATQAERATFVKQLILAVRRHRREASILAAAILSLLSLATLAFIHVAAERRRADTALTNLREAAPLFVAHARALALEGRFDDALKELDYAAALQPTNLVPILYQGELLQSQWRLPEAMGAFQNALQIDSSNAHARIHLQLCSNLLATAQSYDRHSLLRLLFAMSEEKRPILEFRGAFRAFGLPDNLALSLANGVNGLTLAVTNLLQRELNALTDLPLVVLRVANSPGITDLTPLRGMPLADLELIDCIHVRDLGPLRGIPLKTLNLSGCIGLANLEPLQGSLLEKLNLFHTEIGDLSPLRDLPLRILDLRQSKVSDLTPIARMPLREIYLWQSEVKTAEELAPIAALSELEALDASDTDLDDLKRIPRGRLKLLRIGGTRVKDFSPLAGSPLEILHADKLTNTFQIDLDLSPLLQCPRLLWVIVPRTSRNPEILQQHPTVQRASYSFNSESNPAQTITEFIRTLPQR